MPEHRAGDRRSARAGLAKLLLAVLCTSHGCPSCRATTTEDPAVKAANDLATIGGQAEDAAAAAAAAADAMATTATTTTTPAPTTAAPTTTAAEAAEETSDEGEEDEDEGEEGTTTSAGVTVNYEDSIKALRTDQETIDNLEESIGLMHHELNTAEVSLVSFSRDIAVVKQNLFDSDSRARNNTWHLNKLGRRAANLNASLELDDFKLDGLEADGNVTNASVKSAVATADSEFSDEHMQDLQAVTDKLWKITDPTDPDSIDKTKERVEKLTEDTESFKADLSQRIRTILVKRLRRGSNTVRTALQSLGDVAPNDDDAGDTSA